MSNIKDICVIVERNEIILGAINLIGIPHYCNTECKFNIIHSYRDD